MNPYVSEELLRINYLIAEINSAYHEASVKLGLSDSTMMVLYALCINGDKCLLNDIIHQSGISKQTLNSALRKLEKEDLIYLEAFQGRKKMVCLTDKGKAFSQNTILPVVKIENEVIGSWTKEEQKLYLSLTQRYLTAFKEKVKEL